MCIVIFQLYVRCCAFPLLIKYLKNHDIFLFVFPHSALYNSYHPCHNDRFLSSFKGFCRCGKQIPPFNCKSLFWCNIKKYFIHFVTFSSLANDDNICSSNCSIYFKFHYSFHPIVTCWKRKLANDLIYLEFYICFCR